VKKESVFKLLTLALVGIVFLAGVEYAGRWAGFKPTVIAGNEDFSPDSKYGWAQFDPVLGWRNKPGVAISRESGNVPMTFWQDGRRATRPDSSIQPLPQVALLGCSMTQGYGVVDDETFAYRFGALAPGWDVENFGTGGYGAYQSLLTLKRIFESPDKKYAPKLVVYGYAHFHAHRDVAAYDWVLILRNYKGEFFSPPNVVPDGGRLVERGFAVFPLFPFETESLLARAAKKAYIRLKFFNRERHEDEVTNILLTQMRDLAAKNGARLLIMGLTRPTKSVEALVKSGGFEFANCPEFDPDLILAGESFTVGGVGHPNARAHASWARCLAHWMDTHKQASLPKAGPPAPAHQKFFEKIISAIASSRSGRTSSATTLQ
jgi:hypothetical protein